jgi:thiol-disulfide isomerase/thioredoxin
VFKAKRRTVVTVTAALAVLLAGALTVTLLTSGNGKAASDGNSNSVTYPAGHRPLAPDITGTSLTGTAIKLSSYRGKTVVLNFWGSWCAPCRGEAGVLALLDKQYSAKGVAFLGDDVGDTPANALAFTRGVGISYPSINDQGYAVVAQLSRVVPVSDTPTTVVIDKTGHVAGTILGAVNYGEMTTLLRDAEVTQ